ncbi:hypothetical protein KIW74_gp48 [Mycobacterium phage Kimona]|uniref:Uncharacterized protein n=1 Tax=Mycobacterium phage Kimona TaxID=2024295 RepID=A0A249XU26_9CAUD|nr:hypothetical protein KIW74_gp48 [Mycobacterium phage Kimona]ASZ75480.1 hypothetical protein PBI_KIMONA_44 [Mycobacterium phage Kimona]
MTRLYAIEDHDGLLMLVSKDRLWDWLKTERKWKDKEAQRKRAEGVPGYILAERRKGNPEPPRYQNRAARRRAVRALRRSLKPIQL